MKSMYLRPLSDFSSRADYEPQKTSVCEINPKEKSLYPKVTPESVGVSSLYIRDFLAELTKISCDLHHFLMMRHGRIIAEASFAPFLKGTWHAQHGIAKSITNLAIGMLFDEGRLTPDTRLTEIFGSRISFLNSLKLKNISIYDLLIMSSGSTFNESAMHSGNDWAGMFFDAPLHFEPGTRFEYNSMNSYILSAAASAITGKPMDEYLKPRLFEPLGISRYIWERCPKGYTKGGWGLTMYPEDVAKIGQLYLNRGKYNDRCIISEEWISESLKKRFPIGKAEELGYGYQVITGPKEGDVFFSGMMLQETFCFAQNDIIIVINAGGSDRNEDRIRELVISYFGTVYNPPAFLVDNPSSSGALDSCIEAFAKRDLRPVRRRGGWKRKNRKELPDLSFDKMCDLISNQSYVIDTKGYGFMPHFLQYMQNNRTSGLYEVSFEKDQRGLVIHMKEEDRINDLFVSCDRDRYSIMNFKGELFLVSGIGSFARDEDDDLCLKVGSAFIEGECRRFIRFFFKKGFTRIKIELSESPAADEFRTDSETPGFADFSDTLTGRRKILDEKIGESVLWARP